VTGGARSWLAVAGAVAAIVIALLVAAGGDDGPATMDERVNDIASGLRCPVCQNLSVADSPSRLAGEMRSEIETRLEAGETPEEVRAFFVDRYGEWVLLAPERRGLNLLPWVLPIAGLVVGAAIWFAAFRRRPDRRGAPPVTGSEEPA
jgi:cytochrome c-type biogenesis protein CcmH